MALSPGSLWQVEMFVICTPEQSEALLGELVELELSLFTDLGLHFKVLDMPTADLGAPAYRKIDFEVNGRSPPPLPPPHHLHVHDIMASLVLLLSMRT